MKSKIEIEIFRCSEVLPDPCITVLTWHEDDLFPVAAFIFEDGTWIREIEGPEDIGAEDYDAIPDGKWTPLFRNPTHWCYLYPIQEALISAVGFSEEKKKRFRMR